MNYMCLPYVVVEIYEGAGEDKVREQARFEFRSDAVEWANLLNKRETRDYYGFAVKELRLT